MRAWEVKMAGYGPSNVLCMDWEDVEVNKNAKRQKQNQYNKKEAVT